MTAGSAGFAEALAALKAGKPAIFPTDTVYGLGVSVEHARTPQAIYDLKRREAGKPIAWLVPGPEALDRYGIDVPVRAHELARVHWPGALTLIVNASPAVPAAFRSAAGTIGLRMPASNAARALMAALESPLAASSANLSGGPDPVTAADIDPALAARVPVYADDACPASGTASTVVDVSTGAVVVLRQGDILV